MGEMQYLRQMYGTMWLESVKEVVSAERSDVKFIVTDHPVTVLDLPRFSGRVEALYVRCLDLPPFSIITGFGRSAVCRVSGRGEPLASWCSSRSNCSGER